MKTIIAKIKDFGSWLTVLPTIILSGVVYLQSKGVDLNGAYEGLIAFCAAMTAGSIVTRSEEDSNTEDEENNKTEGTDTSPLEKEKEEVASQPKKQSSGKYERQNKAKNKK